jgi:hypothetical protein
MGNRSTGIVQRAAVVIQLDDGRIMQHPLTIEERRFILHLLQVDGVLKVIPCEGVAFAGRELTPTAEQS